MPPSTSPSLTATPPADTFPVSLPNGTWHLCSQRACREHFQYHSARDHGSGGHPYVPWPLLVAWPLWLLWLWTWPNLPLVSSWHNLRRWGGRCAREKGWNIFRTGTQPCHGASCDAPWQGRPTCSQGHSKWRKWCCSRHSSEGGMEALVHIIGRGHLAIPAHQFPYHLPWTAASSDMPSAL